MRQLTPNEIDYILQDVPSFFPNYLCANVKKSYIQTMLNNMREMLEKERVHDDFKDVQSIKKEIELHVGKSIIQPGEGVGVICAQSIGERQTQLSVAYDEEVVYYKGPVKHSERIGVLVDNYFEKYPEQVKMLPNGSEILSCHDLEIKVPMVNENQQSELIPLVEMSRHPPHGDMLRVTTDTGRSVVTTLSHSHLQLVDNKIVPIVAEQLKIGDKIPVLLKRRWGTMDFVLEKSKFTNLECTFDSSEIKIQYENSHDLALYLSLFGIKTFIISETVLSIRDKLYIERFRKCQNNSLLLEETEDIDWQSIVAIERILEHDYSHKHVYDFSVQGDQTFMLKNGIFVHNTLNSFHSSGLCVATVVTGVPRFLELLNATKDPKMSSNTFCIMQNVKTPEQVRSIIESSLINHTLNDLVLSEKIFLEDKEEEFWYGAYETIFSNQFRDYSAGICLHLNVEKIYKYKILLNKIKNVIESNYSDICCVISPLYIGQLDIFVDTSNIQVPEDESLPLFLKTKNYIEIYLEEVVKPKLLELEVCGIKNIKNFHYTPENNRWKIQTEGSNFMEVLCLPYVDISTVSSNNMWEIYNTMGIEATREFLIEEFTNVVSSDGTFINPAHILLLVDVMTFQGNITSVSRYGMKKEQMGVLSRASFEESLDQFCNAGFYSEKDFIKSVSANIMCGKRSSIGSGLCNLMMDWNEIKNKTR